MSYRVIFTKSAEKDLAEIPKSHYSNIVTHIANLAENPRPRGVKKLKGYDNTYRIRIASYRVLFEVKDEIVTVLVVAIAHRKNVYD